MNVPIRIKEGRWNNQGVRDLFEIHKERLAKVMPALAERYDFKCPKRIVLKPLDIRSPYSATGGRYFWIPRQGFSIALNPIYCLTRKDKAIWVIDHETAHIVAGIKFDEWTTHREPHKSIYNFCRTLK